MASRHGKPPNTDSPRQGADDVHLEVVAVDSCYWGEQRGSYSPDRRYRWRHERPTQPIGAGPPISWIGLNPGGAMTGRAGTGPRCSARSTGPCTWAWQVILSTFSPGGPPNPRDLRAAAAAGLDIMGPPPTT